MRRVNQHRGVLQVIPTWFAGLVPVATTQQAFQRSGPGRFCFQVSISVYSARADDIGQLAVRVYALVSRLTSEPAVGVSPATFSGPIFVQQEHPCVFYGIELTKKCAFLVCMYLQCLSFWIYPIYLLC